MIVELRTVLIATNNKPKYRASAPMKNQRRAAGLRTGSGVTAKVERQRIGPGFEQSSSPATSGRMTRSVIG
jgi:hypothetical protein